MLSGNVVWYSLCELFYDYAANTKVNGLYYLRHNNTRGSLRVLWTSVPISIMLFGAYLVVQLINNFQAAPTLIVIDRPRSVYKLQFPAVTFCHPQTVLDYKARQFVKQIQRWPNGSSETALLKALPALGLFVENPWGAVDATDNADELLLIDSVLNANGYTVATAVRQLGLSCEDFIKVCAWSKVEFDCFEHSTDSTRHLVFRTTMSYLGMCCSFNYYPANESRTIYQPYRSPSFGTKGGLSVIGSAYPQVADGKSGVLFSSGFIMLLHHPLDYPVEGNQMTLVEIGAVTSVAVYPTLMLSSTEVLSLPSKKRRCVVDEVDEEITKVYRQPSCAVGCARRIIYNLCKCHPFHIPRGTDSMNVSSSKWIRECNAVDASCFAKYYRK